MKKLKLIEFMSVDLPNITSKMTELEFQYEATVCVLPHTMQNKHYN